MSSACQRLSIGAVLLSLISSHFVLDRAALQADDSLRREPEIRGPICVIDDSADMGDAGSDGFSIGSGRTWPILGYLTPLLGCRECCTWSTFRAKGVACASPCTTKVPPLTQLSPLIETLDNAVSSIGKGDVFFITNGIDWRAEGGDRSFKVEMDVGSILAQWVRSGPAKSVMIGIVQDNKGHARRKNLLIGLMSRPTSIASCEMQADKVNNLPNWAIIRTQAFWNPEESLDHGVLTIYPTVQISGKVLSNSISQAFEIGADGLVRLPIERVRAIEKPQVKLTFTLNPKEKSPFCWGITAVTQSGDRLQGSCDSRASGSVVCTFEVPSFNSWPIGGLRLTLKTAPTVPVWLSAMVADPRHALRRTLKTFESTAEVSRRLRIIRSARTADSLVIAVETSRKY